MKVIPVILSGGFGTRLWPLSREKMPKQFSSEVLNPPLFKLTLDLVSDSFFEKPLIITNKHHLFLVKDILLNSEADIILEPSSKNTAPAILAGAMFLAEKYGDDIVLLVMPSDHLITPKEKFIESIKKALEVVNENIVTFGIKPDKPETGYGYIQTLSEISENIFKVKQFTEKPSIEKARQFVSQGNYYWNAGIFLFKATNYINLSKTLINKTFDAVCKSFEHGIKNENTIELSDDFNNAEKISIDYAILEKISNIMLCKMLANWSDVGSFESLYHALSKDDNNNVIRGKATLTNVTGCFIQNSSKKELFLSDIKDSIIIQTNDINLILPLCKSQDVKQIVESLTDNHLKTDQSKVTRPWGTFEVIEDMPYYKVKKIIVNKGKSLSLQSHKHRAENWVVIKGVATVINGNQTLTLQTGESTFIPSNTKHRLQNQTNQTLEIIEVQTGSYFGEDDIIRYDDEFGRM